MSLKKMRDEQHEENEKKMRIDNVKDYKTIPMAVKQKSDGPLPSQLNELSSYVVNCQLSVVIQTTDPENSQDSTLHSQILL